MAMKYVNVVTYPVKLIYINTTEYKVTSRSVHISCPYSTVLRLRISTGKGK
jgi:hypothetical protein